MSSVAVHHSFDGPEDAPVLVLGGSLGTSGGMWDDQVEAFGEHFRVLRYDTRGHGGSPAPPGPYAMADLGLDLLALLDRLELERVSFCGLSIGGMVGMWASSEAPERFDRLVLCCTVPHFPARDLWDERAATVRAEGMEPMVDPAIERWLTAEVRAARPEAEERLRAMLRATAAEGYAGCCEAIRDMDLRDRLGAIEAPTLVIAGSDDPSTPAERVREIAGAVAGARYVELPRTAHIANMGRPEDFSRAVLEHLVP
ncbi:MAG: 3-oxoadipate enol-lactonase [Thermoleophilaceae bacterium]|nr:3-oxoadipate enol-lactonase [Thermoleophilaceae bacterium]